MALVWFLRALLVLYSSFSAISRMRCLVSSFTFSVGSSFKTRDTVARDTPASIAMSLSVAMFAFSLSYLRIVNEVLIYSSVFSKKSMIN